MKVCLIGPRAQRGVFTMPHGPRLDAASYVGVTELRLPIPHITRMLWVSAPVARAGLVRGPHLSADASVSRKEREVA